MSASNKSAVSVQYSASNKSAMSVQCSATYKSAVSVQCITIPENYVINDHELLI